MLLRRGLQHHSAGDSYSGRLQTPQHCRLPWQLPQVFLASSNIKVIEFEAVITFKHYCTYTEA